MRFRIRERCHALESTFKRLHTRIKNLPQENIYGHTNRLHWIEAQLRAHLQRTHTAKADLKILYADHNSNNLIRSTLVQKGYCITNKPAEVSEDQFKAILCIDQKILPLVHQLAPNGLLLITLQKNHHSIKDLLNIFADLGLQVNNMQASTLFAGTVANTLIKKFPLLLQANIWAAHHLPLSLASGWFFALEKKS